MSTKSTKESTFPLHLNCLILGSDLSHSFTVRIEDIKSVSDLRLAIKNEKEPEYDSIAANSLRLWNVDFAFDNDLNKNVQQVVEKGEPLLPFSRLNRVFTSQPKDDCLHIVVQPPQNLSLEPPQILNLNCLVFQDDPSRVFPVEILNTKTVGALKEAIKDKKNVFRYTDADDLAIWKVSVADDGSLVQNLKHVNLSNADLLLPLQELREVFLIPPIRKHVHIIVKVPPSSLSPPSIAGIIDGLTQRLTCSELEKIQDEVVTAAQKSPPPSSAAMSHDFRREQEKRPIWNGRPSVNHRIPIQLYHPAFAKLLSIAKGNTLKIKLNPEDYSTTQSLFHAAAQIYENEAKRVEATAVFLDRIIRRGTPVLTTSSPVIWTNGACKVECGNVYALTALKEDKNEIGTGGSDPLHQCTMGYRSYHVRNEIKPVLKRSCCPTFFIALAGPWMCILGAVFVDHVVVQHLTDFIWIGGNPYDDAKLEFVTRILVSLRTGITELEHFYQGLASGVHNSQPNSQRFFPFIREYPSGSGTVTFSYLAFLTIPPKAIFHAVTSNPPGQQIIVKFVQRYNVKAHRILEAAGFAPKLLYCSMEDPNSPDLAGLNMVIMEYINGETTYELYGDKSLPAPIFVQIETALQKLHEENIVFGDLRHPNLMIRNECVLFIDFDWCGKHDTEKYPISLNVHPDIKWHPDVKPGALMMRNHDIYMLNHMRP